MAAAIAILTLGIILVYSALKGIGITDILAGATGKTLDPQGGRGGSFPGVVSGGVDAVADAVTGEKGEYKGPNAATLMALEREAVTNYDLKITDRCRPQNAAYGAKNSRHKQCRAFDASGSAEDMRAFAIRAKEVVSKLGGRVYYDPLGWVAPGFSHGDHVHVDA